MGIHCIVGHSASGKSTIERRLEKTKGIPRIISLTTRPMREGEVDGIDYWYLTEEEFMEVKDAGELAEHAEYRNWHYGLSLEGIDYKRRPYIAVVTPKGYREIVEHVGKVHVTSYFVDVEERRRLIRLAKRGDEVDEIIRRILADREDFEGFDKEADYIIHNENLDETVNSLYAIITDTQISV